MGIKFILFMVVLMYVGRKAGWSLTKHVLYRVHVILFVFLVVMWSGGVGFLVGCLDWNLNPNWFIKIIFGLLGGMYVARPNFALSDDIPLFSVDRDASITILSFVCFVAVVGFMVYHNIAHNYGRT